MTQPDSPLRLWRKDRGLDLHEAAPIFGITEAHLSKLETGVSRARDALEAKIIRTTGLSRDQLAEPREWRAKFERAKRQKKDKEREPAEGESVPA